MDTNTIVKMEDALDEVFSNSNEVLVELTGKNYNTIASWRFNYLNNAMSIEKKIEILTRMNYEFIEQSKWKRQAK
jgi:hypothetical protein